MIPQDEGSREVDHMPGASIPSPRLLRTFGVIIVIAFLAVRTAFLLIREPFFDDLFTIWVARKSLPGLFAAIQLDSGPPLYYILVRQFFGGFPSGAPAIELVAYVRASSLLVSLVALAIVLCARHLGPARYLAALLLALFPPNILYSTEARAYILCALLAGVAVIALDRWIDTSRTRFLIIATVAATLAAYSHYYGVVLFPLALAAALSVRKRDLIARGFLASASSAVFFLPGYYLASFQPPDATRWMADPDQNGADILLSALRQLGFAAEYPAALLESPPMIFGIVSTVLVWLTVMIGVRRSKHARFFAVMTLTPVAALALIAQFRDGVYFPVRFESVLSIPFALLLGSSLAAMGSRGRLALLTSFLILGGAVVYLSLTAQAYAAPKPTRRAAIAARAGIGSDAVILATGSSYLELASQTGREWSPRIVSFPSDQALHPGWRSVLTEAELDADRDRLLEGLPRHLVWVGETGSNELRSLTRRCASRPVYRAGPALMAILSCAPSD